MPGQVELHDHSAPRLTLIDVSCCGVLYCESCKRIAYMRDEGRPSDYAKRAIGRIGMFDFNILRQHRREGRTFAKPITKRAPKHGREDWNIWFR
jgi:hypothetical protein